jgi:type II secretory pathway pseudopilin PulG
MIKRKNGYSIVEVVIALSVVVIVTASALSIALSSIAARKNAINKSYAQGFADNVLECFKAVNSYDEFISLVSFAEGVDLNEYKNADGGYTYRSEKRKFTADITVDYDSKRPVLSVYVTDKDGDEIISFSYKKGGVK